MEDRREVNMSDVLEREADYQSFLGLSQCNE